MRGKSEDHVMLSGIKIKQNTPVMKRQMSQQKKRGERNLTPKMGHIKNHQGRNSRNKLQIINSEVIQQE